MARLPPVCIRSRRVTEHAQARFPTPAMRREFSLAKVTRRAHNQCGPRPFAQGDMRGRTLRGGCYVNSFQGIRGSIPVPAAAPAREFGQPLLAVAAVRDVPDVVRQMMAIAPGRDPAGLSTLFRTRNRSATKAAGLPVGIYCPAWHGQANTVRSRCSSSPRWHQRTSDR